MFDFSELKQKSKDVEEWLSKELSGIRTGKATPTILDFVQVEAYGSKMPIRELANMVVEDAKTVRLEPWDIKVGKDIEKAITISNLGLSVAPFEKGLRVIFPELTGERRETFIKIARAKAEETRKRLRRVRDEVWGDIQEKERTGVITEDEKFRFKDDMQKMVDAANTRIGELVEKKEKEIMS